MSLLACCVFAPVHNGFTATFHTSWSLMLASIAPVHPRMPPLHCCLFWVWGMRKFAPCACVVAAPRGCVDILSCSLCGGHRKGWTNSTVREQQSNTLLPLFCPPPFSQCLSLPGCQCGVVLEAARRLCCGKFLRVLRGKLLTEKHLYRKEHWASFTRRI